MLSVVLGVILSTYIIFFSPLFTVATIYIDSSPGVIQEADLRLKDQNLLLLDPTEVETKLLTYPLVKAAKVTKDFPRSLKITITERLPIVVYRGEQTYFIDEEGNILPPLERYFANVYPELACELENINSVSNLNNPSLTSAIKLISQVKHELSIVNLHCLSEQNYQIKVDQTEVIFSSNQDQNQLAASLLFLFKQFRIEGKLPERVDMRFEKPVVVPLSGASLKPTDTKVRFLTYAR